MKPRHGTRALPDFLVIGAQKSATTSLLAYIGGHVGVRLGRKKTAHFFDLNFHRGTRWYARHFPPLSRFWLLPPAADRAWLTGESCPSYMFLPEVPGRVRDLLPEVRLIAILRDPVDRLVSQYHHEFRKGRAPATFEEFIRPSLASGWPPGGEIEAIRQRCAVPRGFYADQVRHWLGFFPRRQLCVLAFEDLVRDPGGTLNEAFRFLGLPAQQVDTSAVLNRGTGRSPDPVDPALRSKLTALYRHRNAGLSDLVGRRFEWCP